MKSKIVISEINQTVITTIKYLIKRILHRSRDNYKLSTNLNLDIDKKRTFVTKIKSKATLKKKSLFVKICIFIDYLERWGVSVVVLVINLYCYTNACFRT